MNITFNELRKIKDNLPAGSMRQIAIILVVVITKLVIVLAYTLSKVPMVV